MPTTTKSKSKTAEPVQGCCGIIDPGMDEAEATLVADRFKALADPTRVRILNILSRNGECCVCDVQTNFELSQPTISHHLSILKKAGLVDCDVRGRWCFYTANTQAISELAQVLEVAR
jgi:ArsR family transcriptional regulator, arsenate/arsenite/antimonite-responsive transcriptional repressor